MRKLALTLTFVISVFGLTASSTHAQEFNFEKAYSDYVYTTEVYRKAHANYLLAKSQYVQAQTLTAQTQAQQATVSMLQSRDDVVITYMRALRMRILEAPGLDELTKQDLFARIDSEIAWYETHKAGISSAGTLTDLEDDSDEASKRFARISSILAYEVLATIPIGKVQSHYSEMDSLLSEIKQKIEAIRQKGDHDTADTERWVLESENKLARSREKQVAVQANINILQSGDFKGSGSTYYEQTITSLQEANQFLREVNRYFQEILRVIKTE